MAQSAILRKLTHELLKRTPWSELRVVYTMVQIRKLIELAKEFDNYDTVYFHCCWAVHTTMTKKHAQKLLILFDQADPLLTARTALPDVLDRQLSEITQLTRFKKQLATFLIAYKLPTHLVGREWTKFCHQYAAVIEDCPLTVTNNTSLLKNIKSVTVHKEDAPKKKQMLGKKYLLYRIVWTCTAKDNKTGVYETYNTIP
jgi:hypothetical protein